MGQMASSSEPVDFEAWYRREHPRLVTLLTAVTGDPELGCEAVDEALARTFERWARVSRMAATRMLAAPSTDQNSIASVARRVRKYPARFSPDFAQSHARSRSRACPRAPSCQCRCRPRTDTDAARWSRRRDLVQRDVVDVVAPERADDAAQAAAKARLKPTTFVGCAQ
jgi:hypothetical protein